MVQLLSNNAIRKRPYIHGQRERERERKRLRARVDRYICTMLWYYGILYLSLFLSLSHSLCPFDYDLYARPVSDIILSRIADALQKWLFVVTRSGANARTAPARGTLHGIEMGKQAVRVRALGFPFADSRSRIVA